MLEKYFRLIQTEDCKVFRSTDFQFLFNYLDQPEVFDQYVHFLSSDNFNSILYNQKLNINFIEKYKDKIDFSEVSLNSQDSDVADFLLKNYFNKLNDYFLYSYTWDRVTYLKYQDKINHKRFTAFEYNFRLLSLKDINKYKEEISWQNFHKVYDYKNKKNFYLYKKYAKYINWTSLSFYNNLSNSFIETFYNYLNLYYLTGYCFLSQRLIEKFADKVNWNIISYNYPLTQKFVNKYYKKLSGFNPKKYPPRL